MSSEGSAIVGFFNSKNDAYHAVSELRDAGFTTDQIGLAIRGEGQAEMTTADVTNSDMAGQQEGEHRSFWQGVKDFFSGEPHESESNEFRQSLGGMDLDQDRSDYYYRGIGGGGALVSVRADSGRQQEARRILQDCGADLRESGFESSRSNVANTGSNVRNIADQDYRVQLRGEMLQAHKERVNRGEVRLRKDVVTENRSIEVPVTREELVIERTDVSGGTPTGEIGSDQEIRVPLSEERVSVEKTPIVTGEVRVGKRQVQENRTVSDNVRHEEVRVEKEGDVNVDEDSLRNRKKPAA